MPGYALTTDAASRKYRTRLQGSIDRDVQVVCSRVWEISHQHDMCHVYHDLDGTGSETLECILSVDIEKVALLKPE